MKNSKKISTLKLSDDGCDSFFLIGIVSHEADYKLSLALNTLLGISLKNAKPVEAVTGENKSDFFSRFVYTAPQTLTTWSLFSNRSDNSTLVRKLNKIDYLLQVYSAEVLPDREVVAKEIKKTEGVIAVFQLDTNDIKDKNLHLVIP